MNTIERVEAWGDKHHSKWMDLLRMMLGAIIFYKGYTFMSNTGALQEMIHNSNSGEVSLLLVYYIIFAQIVGGVMIFFGMATRLAILFQIPILVGAVFFVNRHTGIYSVTNDELWFSVVILFLLAFFLVEGSGPWSLDAVIRKQNHEEDEKYYHNEGHNYL